jgi:hypothetical protein
MICKSWRNQIIQYGPEIEFQTCKKNSSGVSQTDKAHFLNSKAKTFLAEV